jgi:hypothetical protein
MSRRELIGFGMGLVIGLAMAVTLLSDRVMPRALGQAPPATTPRFQFSTWAYPGAAGVNANHDPAHGAFVLDTQTGKLWETQNGSELRSVGQAQ